MAKLPLFFALALVAFLSGCTIVASSPPPLPPPRDTAWQPAYVYAYRHGCWADGVWYAPCPYVPGPRYGYYVYANGAYAWHGQYVWAYRPGYPPPAVWVDRCRPPHHGYRGHAPAKPRSHPRARRF